MLKYFFKLTFRNIRNNKIYTVINVLGLSLGLITALLIGLWVQNELSYDTFHYNASDLYKAASCYEPQDQHSYYLPTPVGKYLKENYPDVENATVFLKQSKNKIIYNKNRFLTKGAFVNSSFFSMFSFPFIIGSPSDAFPTPNSIVITKSLATNLFGNKNPVGKTIELDMDGLEEFTVSGVLEDCPTNSDLKFEYLVPFELISEYMNSWDYKVLETYVQLKKGTDYQSFNTKIKGVISKFKPDWNNRLYITPLTRCHLYNLEGSGRIQSVYIFSFVAILILVIAIFNFINLAMARSDKRLKEIGVNKILGSRKKHLILQYLLETQMLALVSLVLSLVLLELILPAVNLLLNLNLNFNYNFYTIAVLLGITVSIGLSSGLYPAFSLSSAKPINVLRNKTGILIRSQKHNNNSGSSQKIQFRSALVVFQFALTIILITGIIVIRHQLQYVQEKDLGFDKENILVVNMEADLKSDYATAKQQLLQMSEVSSVAISQNPITTWIASCSPDWEGKSSDNIFDMGVNYVDYDFAKTLGIKLLEGRFFSKEFSSDATNGFVINEAAVKAMGLNNPVGTNMSVFQDTPYERKGKIIGVIKNIHTESLYSSIKPFVYTYAPSGSYMYIKTNASSGSATVKTISKKIKSIVPDDLSTISFLDNDLNQLYISEQTTEKLMEGSSLIAIVISCLGLFGLSFYGTKLRIKEIGIRKVNGAKVSEVLTMLNKDFVKWVFIAFIIATPVAWYAMHKWLDSFAYKTTLSWWIFALSGILALGIALLTVSWQSWRAATRNPVEALRYE
ncbi:ABC transporter permease [Saccharicrinis sp. FJH2]|uniref:ABC transporter permease n=1 Tax=Saccharicrinis sp. FJH65 TaxID=3344659 RepID=UPI0035F4ACC6